MIPDVLGIAVVLIVGYWIGHHRATKRYRDEYWRGFRRGQADMAKNILRGRRRKHKRATDPEQQSG